MLYVLAVEAVKVGFEKDTVSEAALNAAFKVSPETIFPNFIPIPTVPAPYWVRLLNSLAPSEEVYTNATTLLPNALLLS